MKNFILIASLFLLSSVSFAQALKLAEQRQRIDVKKAHEEQIEPMKKAAQVLYDVLMTAEAKTPSDGLIKEVILLVDVMNRVDVGRSGMDIAISFYVKNQKHFEKVLLSFEKKEDRIAIAKRFRQAIKDSLASEPNQTPQPPASPERP